MFDNKEIVAKLADIHDIYVVVPVDKASNNVVFVCKNSISVTNVSKHEILSDHKSVLSSHGIS